MCSSRPSFLFIGLIGGGLGLTQRVGPRIRAVSPEWQIRSRADRMGICFGQLRLARLYSYDCPSLSGDSRQTSSGPQNALRLSPPSIPPPFSRHGLRHPPLLRSLRHNTIPSAPSRLTPTTVPSPHLYRPPKRSVMHRAASPYGVYLLHSCTAQAPLRPPTHPVHTSHLPMQRRV